MKRVEKDIKKWWEEASSYYQEENKIGIDSAHYGPYSPNEDKLKLLGNVKGKKILEIGCGGGQCSISFAKKGARCIGIDISEKQLEYAKKLAKKNKVKIDFRLGTFQDLSKIKSKSQDIVFSAFALQYSPNIKRVFKQIYRILKKNGIFVFSLDHPFYHIINPKNNKIEKSYFKTGKFEEVEIWPDKSKHRFIIYRRRVSDLYNTLVESGFIVERILEPISFNEKEWRNDDSFPKELAKLIGPTIIFKARKRLR